MPPETSSIKAIRLVRTVFEFVHGNLGVLSFNVDELNPVNEANGGETKKWKVVCSFFETVGSSSPSKYEALVNLNDDSVTIKKLGVEQVKEEKYIVSRQKKAEGRAKK